MPGAWKPKSRDPNCPLSKVNLILNKITKEKFLPLSLEIQVLFEDKIIGDEQQRLCATYILEKMLKEPHYVDMYVELCTCLIDRRTSFKNIFIKTVQTSFQNTISSKSLPSRGRKLKGFAAVVSEMYLANLIPISVVVHDLMLRLLFECSDESIEALCVIFKRVWERMIKSPQTKHILKMLVDKFDEFRKDRTNAISSRVRFVMMDVTDKKLSDDR